MIKIFDNFYTKDENDKVNLKLSEPHWSYTGGGQTEENDYFSFFWHMDDLEKDDFFLTLYAKAVSHLQLKNPSLIRIYANGQTAGQTGLPHEDDGDTTILYFPVTWKHIFGGHLYFLENNDIKSVVEYKQNRLVAFSANTTHYSSPPERQYLGLRTSLAFKVKHE